jgi:Protein of unknown function (DUF2628)
MNYWTAFEKFIKKWNDKAMGIAPIDPVKTVAPPPLNMQTMNLSDKWQERFQAIHNAGGYSVPLLINSDFQSRRLITFNGYAFCFGIFYYLKLGMKKRSLILLLLSLIVVAVLHLIMFIWFKPSLLTGWFSLTLVFAFMCNRDYYNFRINGVDEFKLK